MKDLIRKNIDKKKKKKMENLDEMTPDWLRDRLNAKFG